MTDKVATLSNHLSRDLDELDQLIEAIEDAGYRVEGPKSNDSLGMSGSDYNDYYWTIRDGGSSE